MAEVSLQQKDLSEAISPDRNMLTVVLASTVYFFPKEGEVSVPVLFRMCFHSFQIHFIISLVRILDCF